MSEETNGECLICGQPSHGVHFGVSTCRACAAFFRRTVVSGNQYVCRRRGPCTIRKDERLMCQKCRFDKCLREGMKTDNVQYHRDRLCATQSRGGVAVGEKREEGTSPQPDPPTVAEPLKSTVVFNPIIRVAAAAAQPPPPSTSFSRCSSLAMTPDVVHQIDHVFASFTPTFDLPIQPTLLQRMSIGYERHVRARIDDVKVYTEFDVTVFAPIWKRHIVEMAKWTMYCPAFAQLGRDDKFALFSSRMAAFIRLEKTWISLKLYESQKENVNFAVFVVADNVAIDLQNVKMDVKGFSNASAEQIRGMFQPVYTEMVRRVAQPILETRLSQFEMVYMLCTLLWSVEEVPDISQAAHEKAEIVRDSIANELHDYFLFQASLTRTTVYNDKTCTCQMDTSNYAHRMMLIMRIINSIDDVIHERTSLFEMAHLFDIIKPSS